MKFYGEPNQLVKQRTKKMGAIKIKPLFRFDNNGEYETDNPDLIKKLQKHFKYDDEPKFKCKKCGFETDSKGKLLAHYREKHKAGD